MNQHHFSDEEECMKTTSHGKYKIYNSTQIYSNARKLCRLSGGHLAAFETEAEYNAFGTFPEHYWIGALKKDGKQICSNLNGHAF